MAGFMICGSVSLDLNMPLAHFMLDYNSMTEASS